MRTLWTVTVATALAGCGPVAEFASPLPGSEHQGIVGGENDVPEQFPGVVRISTGTTSCTGTLVAAADGEGWVLTAGHCILAIGVMPFGYAAEQLTVFYGAQVQAATPLAVSATTIHPRYSQDRSTAPLNLDAWPTTQSFDQALLKVVGVTPEMAATAIPWMTAAEDDLEVGRVGTEIGYGSTNPVYPGIPPVRQRASIAIAALFTTLRHQGQQIMLDERGDLPGACYGDSGGPLVFANSAGEQRVGGVVSSVSMPGAGCRGLAYSGRVSQTAADFIEPTLAGNPPAAAGCYACLYQASVSGSVCHAALTADPEASTAFTACLDSGTLTGCRASQAAGAAVYDDYLACIEQVACAGLCSPADRTRFECRFNLDGAGPCDACVQASPCCEAAARCSLDPYCAPCLNRLDASDVFCARDPLFHAFRQCMQDACSATCDSYMAEYPPLELPDAGSVDALVDASAPDAAPEAGEPDACGCRTTTSPGTSDAARLSILVGIALALRHRRRRRPARCR